ncbi:prenylcysteine oxidase 1-like [Schistocerca nitens]|uniref:prenylcysteine oxidase 1-like n=1 Tax=Schistocerca nitens TaxID=7011 RepID=UPI0021174F2F|nr:prenylcysteine oxidase 1-like [Schistocerca nitens]
MRAKQVFRIFLLSFCLQLGVNAAVPRIGVIGGGIGGTGAAYFLRKLFGPKGIKIDVYEQAAIGGRLATVNVDGFEYETGGSVIHPKNHYVVGIMKELGLGRRKTHESTFGLYDGNKFLFREANTWNFINTLKILWRYGINVITLQDYVSDMLGKFERIYGLQKSGFAFPSVNDLMAGTDLELAEALHVSLKEALLHEGFSKLLIDELVTAAIVVDYGQTTDVHQFVGSVALAGAGAGLFAVEGGNFKLPVKMLDVSGATLKKVHVSSIELLNTGKYLIHSTGNHSIKYDAVIMAFPYAENINSNFTFKNFPSTFIYEPSGNYHRTVSTVVKGELNHTFFGFEDATDVVDEILCVRTDLAFNSIGRIYPVSGTPNKKSDVWKVFSQVPLSREQIDSLFKSVDKIVVKDWLAYPHYRADWRHDKFRIHDNLYHINAIEWAASAMEMSLVGAKNVALSFYHDWGEPIVEATVEETVKLNLKVDL